MTTESSMQDGQLAVQPDMGQAAALDHLGGDAAPDAVTHPRKLRTGVELASANWRPHDGDRRRPQFAVSARPDRRGAWAPA